jgi:hypothetical protein
MPRPFASPLWRSGAFLRVWTAAAVSTFGSLITRMALPFVAILVLSAGLVAWADLGRALLLLSVPLAFVLGLLTLWQLFAVTIVTGVLTTFFDAADNAYLPSIVEHEELVDANSALAASGSAAEFTAFGISGFLIQALTAPIAILIDAVTFLASAVLLSSIQRPESAPPVRALRIRSLEAGVVPIVEAEPSPVQPIGG